MEETKKTTTTAAKSKKASLTSVMVDGGKGNEIELPQEFFNIKASDRLLALYVRVFLANQRQGTQDTKTRSEVVATTKKIYRQKGTGRARHGANTASLFSGGGVTHGPHPRSHILKLNKKQRQKALFYALSLMLNKGNMIIVEDMNKVENKTKGAVEMFDKIGAKKGKICFVYSKVENPKAAFAVGNIEGLSYRDGKTLNAYDVLTAQKLVFTKEALTDFITLRQAKVN